MCDAPLPIGRLEFTTKLTLVDLELRFIFHSIKVYFFLVIATIPTTYIPIKNMPSKTKWHNKVGESIFNRFFTCANVNR